MTDAARASDMPHLTYLRQGRGEPLVLVHGYLGGAAIWQQQLESLSDQFDVIAPEIPGYGSSTKALARASIKGYAEEILELLDTLGVHRFNLLGHSMGGMIVQQIVAMVPHRVMRLVCYGTGPRGVLPDRFETIEQSRARLTGEGVAPTARRIAATWFARGEKAGNFADCVILGENVSTASALAGLTAMETWDGRAALEHIRQPTLVVWGDKDRSYGWAQPQALWTGIANSNLAVMPGCGHNAHQENPQMFNSIIRDFLLTEDAPQLPPMTDTLKHNQKPENGT